MHLYQVLKRPVVTEKSTLLSAETRPQYTFQVAAQANKHLIKQAVEKVFNVHVVSVNVTKVPSRPRRWGRIMGRKPEWKKAVVTLAEGDSISFFEGV